MSKAKVYLAKSNKSNPNVVSRVRQTLSEYDVEIVEFTGGKYTDKAMLDCDFLVVVPEFCESWSEDGVIVGKGLYEQLDSWEYNNDPDNVFFIIDENLLVGEILDMSIEDSSNYIDYGLVEIVHGRDVLSDILEDVGLPLKPKSAKISSNSESEYYILIAKKA